MGSSHPSANNQQQIESSQSTLVYPNSSQTMADNAANGRTPDPSFTNSQIKREMEEEPSPAPKSKAQRKNPPKYNSGAKMEESRVRITGIQSRNTKTFSKPCITKMSPLQLKEQSHLGSSSHIEVTTHPLGHNLGYAVTEDAGMLLPNTATPEFIMIEPGLPPSNGVYRDVDDEYHEVLMGLLQAIHNQNQIMEECRNILKSIHNVMTTTPNTTAATPASAVQEQEMDNNMLPYVQAQTNGNNNNYQPPAVEAPATEQAVATQPPAPQAPVNGTTEQPTRETASSRDPDKPQVYGTDGEFSCTYLRHIFGKSSTATSFANVLMKEIFTLEERISSNCNGVMGKKALDSIRLEKIKKAVKRFYADSEADFQDLWKKCRKSIDSTNRNLKFIIMKRPNYIDS